MDLEPFFEKSVCESFASRSNVNQSRMDAIDSEHCSNVPVLRVNQRRNVQTEHLDEPNSSFQLFSYLISDMINQNASIQYPSRKDSKGYRASNTTREKCLTVGDEVDYENETICFLNEDDLIGFAGRKTVEPTMYPFKTAREGNDRRKYLGLENRCHTVGDEIDIDSSNEGDCDINCSERKIKNFEMVKCSVNFENKISARNSITSANVSILTSDPFKKNVSLRGNKLGRKRIFTDDREDMLNKRKFEGPQSFCHALPNDSISTRGTRSFIESPSELKQCMEGIIMAGNKPLRTRTTKNGVLNSHSV